MRTIPYNYQNERRDCLKGIRDKELRCTIPKRSWLLLSIQTNPAILSHIIPLNGVKGMRTQCAPTNRSYWSSLLVILYVVCAALQATSASVLAAHITYQMVSWVQTIRVGDGAQDTKTDVWLRVTCLGHVSVARVCLIEAGSRALGFWESYLGTSNVKSSTQSLLLKTHM